MIRYCILLCVLAIVAGRNAAGIDDLECASCKFVFGTVRQLVNSGLPKIVINKFLKTSCMDLHIGTQSLCKGIINYDLDIVYYIMKHDKDIPAAKFCSLLMKTSCHNEVDFYNWTIDVPKRPEVIPPKKKNDNPRNLKILHITDLHYDPRYTVGSSAVCAEELCCQDDQGTPEDPKEACGIWGDYRLADVPRNTLDELLKQTRTHDVDLVYFTGDIIPHRVWSTSKSSNSQLEREVMGLLSDNFDVPVFFVLGNHEPHPVNAYAPINVTEPQLSTKWLFEELSAQMATSLPENDQNTISKGGFYTTMLKPGLRLVVLNNNICYTDNLWLAYDSYDIYGQLIWLIQILEEAERNGEYVHLLQHLSTGDECLGAWGRAFTQIINRFSDTVAAQFLGHTHLDEFFLYYNETDPNEAIHVAYNGASVTPFSNNNPSYKIYEVAADNYEVLDFEEWTFNLTDANLQVNKTTLDWYKLYSFKEAYGVHSMEPKILGQLVIDMAKNRTHLENYNRYKYRMGAGADIFCDDDCHKLNLCRIVTSFSFDTEHCEYIKHIYDVNNRK